MAVAAVVLRLFIIAGVVFGTVSASMRWKTSEAESFLYYTKQSNIWIATVAGIFAVFDVISLFRGEAVAIPKALYIIKFIFTVAITVTGIVFGCVLLPAAKKKKKDYKLTPYDLSMHIAVPALSLADFFLFTRGATCGKFTFLLGTATLFYYLLFVMFFAVRGKFFRGKRVPYFFMDYEKNGWFSFRKGKIGVVYWFMAVIFVTAVLSFALLKAAGWNLL